MRSTKLVSLCCSAVLLGGFSLAASADQKLFVYTSMKESMIGGLKTAFQKKHPDVKVDFQSAGAGKLMAKIAAERESGKILADVLWTSEVPDFYQLKAAGVPAALHAGRDEVADQPAARLRRFLHRGPPRHARHRLQHAPHQGSAEDLGRPEEARIQGRLRHRQPGPSRVPPT